MDITFDKKNSIEGLIKVRLSEEDYQSKVRQKLKEYGKKITLKGFRPGKVPPGLVNKMYGKSILAEEINSLLASSLRTYIEENDLQILGDPLPIDSQPIDWDTQKEFEFDYELGLVDEFEIDLAKLKATDYEIGVDQEEIDKIVEENREKLGEMIVADAIAESDYVTFQVKDESAELSESMYIGIEQFKATAAKKFKGKKEGDIINIDIKKSFEDQNMIKGRLKLEEEAYEKLSKKTSFEVEKIQRSEKAEVNQEFFDKLFGEGQVKSREELDGKIGENMRSQLDSEAKQFKDYEVRKQLLEQTKIDLPKDFLKKWLLASNQNKITSEQLESEFDMYVESLKWNLITDHLVKKFEITVEGEEVREQGFKALTRQFGGMPLNDDMKERLGSVVEQFLQQDEGKNYMDAYNQVKMDKVFSRLGEEVKGKKKKLSLDAFKKIVEKAN